MSRIKEFRYKYKTVHWFWSIIPFSKVQHDISDELNQQIAAVDGEAVTNFTINGMTNAWNFWSSFILGLGFVFPGYSNVELHGDIVCKKISPSVVEGELLSEQVEAKDESI